LIVVKSPLNKKLLLIGMRFTHIVGAISDGVERRSKNVLHAGHGDQGVENIGLELVEGRIRRIWAR
jgi:hypothetical protein